MQQTVKQQDVVLIFDLINTCCEKKQENEFHKR